MAGLLWQHIELQLTVQVQLLFDFGDDVLVFLNFILQEFELALVALLDRLYLGLEGLALLTLRRGTLGLLYLAGLYLWRDYLLDFRLFGLFLDLTAPVGLPGG